MALLVPLPLEIWHKIATIFIISAELPGDGASTYTNSAVYLVLVRVARRFALPDAKAVFIRREHYSNLYKTTLPCGHVHSIGGDPRGFALRPLLVTVVAGGTRTIYCTALGRRRSLQPPSRCVDGKRREGLPFIITNSGDQAFLEESGKLASYDPNTYAGLITDLRVINDEGKAWWCKYEQVYRKTLPAVIAVRTCSIGVRD